MNENILIKQYENLTKSKMTGRLGDRIVFKKNGKYRFINLTQIKSIVKKGGK